MLILTLAATVRITRIFYVSPFVLAMKFSYTQASWWTSTFGAPSEPSTASPSILDILVNFVAYTHVTTSESDMEATPESWYYDGVTLWIHLGHELVWDGEVIQYGRGVGYSDTSVIYIGQVEYLPIVSSPPELQRSEDIRGYQRLTLLSGDVQMTNRYGVLDSLADDFIVGNNALLAYVPNESVVDGFVDASEAVPQALYYVEDVIHGQEQVVLSLQDTRKLQKFVPTRVLDATTYPFLNDSDVGKPVQLVYGACRSVKCTPVTSTQTGTTDATYRCAELLTSITQVRVKIGDTWTVKVPSSTDLANGTFTLATSRASAGQAPYECVADVVGIAVTYAPDIIVDLYSRFLSQAFTAQFYDTATWDTNKVLLPTCGLVIERPTDILDIIPMIQNGVYPGFRFDVNVQGLRTIIVDDRTKNIGWFVGALEIADAETLEVVEMSDYLSTAVTVAYDKEYNKGEFRRVTDASHASYVQENYQWQNTLEIESLLTTAPNAQAMATARALEYRDTTRTISLTLMGDRFFGVWIYDIMQVDTAMGRAEYYTGDFDGREFFGIIVGQVISIKPDFLALTMKVTLRILDREPELENITIILSEDEKWFTDESGILLVGA